MVLTDKVVTIGDSRYRLVKLANGEEYRPSDLNISTQSAPETGMLDIQKRVRANPNAINNFTFGRFGVIEGWSGGYWMLQKLKEPEVNEFGPVTP